MRIGANDRSDEITERRRQRKSMRRIDCSTRSRSWPCDAEAFNTARGKTPPKDCDEIKISIKQDGSDLQHTEQTNSDNTVGGIRSISHEGNGINYKVSLSNPEGASSVDKSQNNEQATIAEEKKNKDDTTDTDDSSTSNIPPESATLQSFSKLTLNDISDDELSWASDVNSTFESSSSDCSEDDNDSDSDANLPWQIRDSNLTKDLSCNKTLSDAKKKDPWNAVCTFGLKVHTQGPPAVIEFSNGREEEAEKGKSGRNMGVKS